MRHLRRCPRLPGYRANFLCQWMGLFLKERFQFFKRNDIHLIVKVSVVCTGDHEQFLVIASQLAVRRLTEIAGVRLFSVYQQHGGADLAAVLQNRHIQERQRRRHIPAAVGVQAAGMVRWSIWKRRRKSSFMPMFAARGLS